jgi:hypothetical protein
MAIEPKPIAAMAHKDSLFLQNTFASAADLSPFDVTSGANCPVVVPTPGN